MSLPINIPTNNLFRNKKYTDYNDKIDKHYKNISKSCPIYERNNNSSSFEDYYNNKHHSSLSISAGGGSSPICPDKRMHVIMMMKPRDEIENYKNEIIEKNDTDIELAQQEIENDIMKESLGTSSLESYMIMYLSDSDDEQNNKLQHNETEYKNEIINNKNHKTEKITIEENEQNNNEDSVPFFESEYFPFNDQTFEDVALYLWNQQQQYELEEQTF